MKSLTACQLFQNFLKVPGTTFATHNYVVIPILLFHRFIAESRIDTWIMAYGSMSKANVCNRLPCSKTVEKHWLRW